jgi:hypothetical protein
MIRDGRMFHEVSHSEKLGQRLLRSSALRMDGGMLCLKGFMMMGESGAPSLSC